MCTVEGEVRDGHAEDKDACGDIERSHRGEMTMLRGDQSSAESKITGVNSAAATRELYS